MNINTRKLLIPALFSMVLAACGGSGGGGTDPAPAPNPGPPAISISDATIEEGNAGSVDLVFSVSLNATSASAVTVDFSTADGTADASDYLSSSGQVSISVGQTSVDVVVPVLGDLLVEMDEDFTVGLTNPVNAGLGKGIGIGSITNDDFPRLSVSDATVEEGDTGTATMSFDVTLDQPGVSDITVDYASSDVTASIGSDYAATAGTLTVPAGDVSASVDVIVSGDVETEADEQLLVNLLNASSNARIDDDEGIGVILNDDLSKASIEPAVLQEPDSGANTLTLLVVLNAPASDDIEVGYATSAGSATPGSDYTESSGTVTIPAGSVDAGIIVEILGDLLVENSETIEVELTSITGPATLGQVIAYASILDNDDPNAPLSLSGSGGGVLEGDSGTTEMLFQFALNKPAADAVAIVYSTANGSATSPEDYVALAGSVSIPVGETSVLVSVPIVGETLEEDSETVLVNIDSAGPGVIIATPQLSGTIVDDDTEETTPVRLSIRPAEVTEGDIDSVDLVFDLSLDKAASAVVTVDYRTDAGSATEGVDYLRVEGTLTFQSGELAKSVAVEVIGDNFSEDTEFLRLRLSNLTGGAVFDGSSALGTIITDEPLTRLSIADVGGPEGDSGNSDQVFTVSLNVASAETVSFDFATSDGTAVAGEDYIQASGAVQIPPGDLAATISVSINGDFLNEDDESYTLTLSNVSVNAVVLNADASGTIVNDDGTPGWQTPVSLGIGFEPEVVLDDDGNGVIVYTGPTSSVTFTSAAQITRIENGIWQPPIELGDYTNAYLREPLAATLGNGELMVTWGGNIGSAVYTPGSGWAEQEIYIIGGFQPGLDGNRVGMAIAGGSVPIGGSGPESVWRNVYEPASGWGTAELAENDDTGVAANVKVAIDDAGNKFLFWRQSFSDPDLSGMYFDYYDAATAAWMGATRYSDLPAVRNYNVSMLGDGRAVVIVQMPEGLGPDRVDVFFFDPATLSFLRSGTLSSRGSESEILPELVVDDSGNVFAIWVQARSDGFYDAWSNRYDAAAETWSTPTRLESGDGDVRITGGAVDIAVDGAGNAIAAWSQATVSPNNDFRVRTSQYSVANDEWSPAEQIDDDARDEYPKWVRVAMDASGNAVVVWEYDTGNDIGAARFIAP